MKALVLISGGLDSSLAVCVLQRQNIEVEAIHFRGVFHAGNYDEYDSYISRFSDTFGVKVTTFRIQDDFLEVLKNPAYGYGKNINPCVDCRIYILKRAKVHMEETGASFVATGEVLGQRPMSQRKSMMDVVAKKSGLGKLLLRPLSAKLLEPTIPEENGWVDRDRLYGISGRSRKPQIELARRFGIRDYPAPAGGCLLTDPRFADRVKDLIRYNSLTLRHMELLKTGRHFRLSAHTKLIVGRHHEDNMRLLNFVKRGDILLKIKEIPGPLALVIGKPTAEDIERAAGITARYSKGKDKASVAVMQYLVQKDGGNSPFFSDASLLSILTVSPACEGTAGLCAI